MHSASQYATQAIRCDASGDAVNAIVFYQLAIRSMTEFVGSRPDFELRRTLIERANAYQNRVNFLLKQNPNSNAQK